MAVYGDLVAFVTQSSFPLIIFFDALFCSYYEWLGQEDRLKTDGAEADEGFPTHSLDFEPSPFII
jgi:hypothetical protein